ncbi:hypothetical protein JTB14_034791 [Gonioctena quinquepunctata]|nr:hypothetical protein JTB14_034791 [Gonioctena quinquepunctata]
MVVSSPAVPLMREQGSQYSRSVPGLPEAPIKTVGTLATYSVVTCTVIVEHTPHHSPSGYPSAADAPSNHPSPGTHHIHFESTTNFISPIIIHH